MNSVKVTSNISLEQYRNMSLALLYQNRAIKVITAIGIFIILMVIYQGVVIGISSIHPTMFLVPFTMTVLLPLMSYLKAKGNYNSNPTISEEIKYSFNDQGIISEGESFNTNLSWVKIYKVSENKNWIFIWQSKQSVNAVHISSFASEDFEAFKLMVDNQRELGNIR